VTQDDVLFGYRLQLFRLAEELGVSKACRVMGVNRSPTTAGSRRSSAPGSSTATARAAPTGDANQLSLITEQRIVAFALGHPRLGLKRIAAQLDDPNGAVLASALTESGRRYAGTD